MHWSKRPRALTPRSTSDERSVGSSVCLVRECNIAGDLVQAGSWLSRARLNQRWGEFSLGVSRCCASVFYLLVQIKVTKTKDTLSCADATHRCPARLRPKEASRKLAALRATQTSVCLFLFRPPLLGAAPKGTEYRLKTGSLSLRHGDRKAIFGGRCRRRVRPERS